jgi:hypothetical protein
MDLSTVYFSSTFILYITSSRSLIYSEKFYIQVNRKDIYVRDNTMIPKHWHMHDIVYLARGFQPLPLTLADCGLNIQTWFLPG